MFAQNSLKNDFLLSEYFNLKDLLPLIERRNIQEWKMHHFKIEKDQVIFNNKKNNEELVMVIEGKGGITVNGVGGLIRSGNLLCIPKNSLRSLANIENEPLQVVVVSIN